MKHLFTILFLSSIMTVHSQEITVRKKYLDSIKNQLAIYTTETYTLLNENERYINKNKQLEANVQEMKNLFYYQEMKLDRQFRIFGAGFVLVATVFIYGIFKITK